MGRVVIVLIFLVVALSMSTGCVALRPGEVARLPASGIEGAISRQAVIGNTGQSRMIGQVLVLRQHGGVTLTAEVGQTWDSGQGRLRMTGAWSEGAELPFEPVTRYERICLSAGNCQAYRTGTFLFGADDFAAAAREGYAATLIGPDAVVEILIPAALFVEARERARASGIWDG